MLKFKKPKLNNVKELFKKLPRILGENPFLTSLTFILISLIIGSIVFYKYSVLVKEKESEDLGKPLFLNEEALQKVLKTWENRQKKFNEAGTKEHLNPFQ